MASGETGLRRLRGSARTRIVGWFLLLLVVAEGVSVLAVRQLLLLGLEEEFDRELTQEVEELRTLERGSDPQDGQPFGDRLDRLFSVFLSRNIPDRDEFFLTFLDGELYERSRGQPLARLDEDPAFLRAVAGAEEARRGRMDSAAGPVEYLSVPLEVDGEPRGLFCVFIFRGPEVAEIDSATRAQVSVAALVLLLASSILWSVAGRILSPVRQVTRTARQISDTDLSQRIEVRGADEVSELTRTVNAMLDRLETAFRSQRDFVNDAGHELRTPITIVRGHLELLGNDPADLAEAMPLVLDELDRMSRFVDDLLVLAKAQRLDFLHLETVDISALAGEIVSKARPLADRDWRLEGRGRARIVADRQRLTQAVMQLATNATQHTEPGDTIAIGSAVNDGSVRFWVRDTGKGVPPAEQQRIFERFARASGSHRGAGSGLGLAIVKAIAEAHHGSIELRSGLGAGATFTLVLPFDQPEGHGDGP